MKPVGWMSNKNDLVLIELNGFPPAMLRSGIYTADQIREAVERVMARELGGGEHFDCDVAANNAAVRRVCRALLAEFEEGA